MKDEIERCQSCGMAFLESNYGTNKDLSPNLEYCHFCFNNGAFTSPDLTLEKQMNKLSEMAMKKSGLSKDAAIQTAKKILPTLKRWQ